MTETPPPARPADRCRDCATELAPQAIVCPVCHALVHADTLRKLAARAEELTAAGQLDGARDTWERALRYLPEGSEQHEAISARITSLTTRITAAAQAQAPAPAATGAWWKRGAGGLIAVAILLASKLKFVLLGLAKLPTLLSMVAFFGVYWSTFGWPLALGLVISIYIHEMGHVAELKRLGIKAGAPFFIPGLGALVLLKQKIDDPVVDARIGLAGPIWGLAAGAIAWGAYFATGAEIWKAIGELTGYINLFNLIPIWQLDGSRGFHAMSASQRWLALGVIVVTYLLTWQKMLIIVGAVAAFRAFRPGKSPAKGHWPTTSAYVALVFVLAFMAGKAGG